MVGAAAKPPATPQPPGNKPRPSAPPREEGSSRGRRPGQIRLWARIVLSLLVVWHLTAVFLAPLSIPPTSRLVIDIAQGPLMQWYLDALYINHGYSFFAPDPGPGHLVFYEVYDEQGNLKRQGKFPDRDVQWPRLWYHRHFMLADQVGLGLRREEGPGEGERKYLAAYARQLLRKFGGESARVRWMAHDPLSPFSVRPNEPINLDTPQSYRELMPPVVQRSSDLGPESRVQTFHPPGYRPDVARGWAGARR